MPHCIVEYSHELAEGNTVNNILSAVFQGSVNSDLFTPNDIKTRAVPFEHYQVGEGDKQFIHVACKILSGRTSEQKQSLSQAILSQLALLPITNVSITVEVLDIDTASYGKTVN